jgi:hypothetical protein
MLPRIIEPPKMGDKMRKQPQDEGAPPAGADDKIKKALAELRKLAEAVAAAWTAQKSGVDLVDEQRR